MLTLRSLRRVLIVGLLAVASVVVTTAAIRGRKPYRVTHVDRFGGPDGPMVITASVADGWLDVTGKGCIGPDILDQRFRWFVALHQRDPEGKLVQVWEREYLDQLFDLPAGQVGTPTFRDRFPTPGTGRYLVRCGVRESRPSLDAEGNLLADQPSISVTKWIDVL
jgi:hypothetical protein